MANQAVLMREIAALPPARWGEVLDFVEHLQRRNRNETRALERAAEKAAAEYAAGQELTAFCVLDGEPFYESR